MPLRLHVLAGTAFFLWLSHFVPFKKTILRLRFIFGRLWYFVVFKETIFFVSKISFKITVQTIKGKKGKSFDLSEEKNIKQFKTIQQKT